MNYELISEEEYAGLPIEDDRCFVEFENICRRNMMRMIDTNTSSEFDNAVRQQYMAAVASVAIECNIPNIRFIEKEGQSLYDDFAQFSLAVQGEVARIRIRQRGERHPLSVLLTGNTRIKIEHYVSRIRDVVSKSDLDYDRKKRLDEKLDQLLKELSNQRLSFGKTMAILAAVTATIAGATTIAADGQDAVTHIMQLIGLDKETEEAAAQRLSPPLKALPAPQGRRSRETSPATQKPNYDLDDDIPF